MRKSFLTLSLGGLLLASPAWAGPEGGTVVSGSATIVNGAGGTTIRQQSDRAILNWSRFSTSPGELVRFLQPSSSAAVLNRVTGLSPSFLLGELSATGRVFLVNPSGIVFGPTSQVNVGSLFATTMQISDQDFMQGNYVFVPAGAPSFVLNQGTIRASEGGYVVLMAPVVENQGTIVARLGTVTLASVPQTTVSFDGRRLVHYVLPEGPPGDVLLPGDFVSEVVGSLVTTSATDAAGVELAEGQVRLVGASGMLVSAGRIEAAEVTLQGDRVAHTGALEARQAELVADRFLHSSTESLIRAERALLLAGDTASLHGAVEIAPGGFLETSAPGLSLSASPRLGAGSTWLIDPNDLTITNLSQPGTVTDQNPFVSLTDNATIAPSLLESALALGTTVIVQTGTGDPNSQAGDLIVADPIVPLSPGAGGVTSTLLLQAHRDVVVLADIGGNVPLNVALEANFQGTSSSGDVRLVGGDVRTLGGSFTSLGAALQQSAGLVVDTAGGDVNLLHTGSVTLDGSLLGGTVVLQGQGPMRAARLVGESLEVRSSSGSADLVTQVTSLRASGLSDLTVRNSGDLALQGVDVPTVRLTTDGALTGAVSRVPALTAQRANLSAGGDINLTTRVGEISATTAGEVTLVDRDGDLSLRDVVGSNVRVTSAGDLIVGVVRSPGRVELTADGSIRPGAGSLLTAQNGAALQASGIIGQPAVPLSVSVLGELSTVARDADQGISVNVSGQVVPSQTLVVPNQPPGRVLLNGREVGGEPPPPVIPVEPVVPPIDPPVVDPVAPPDVPPPSDQPPVPEAPDPTLPARVAEAVGAGDQQINNLIPPELPAPADDPAQIHQAERTAQAQLGYSSSMSPTLPPQKGDAARFVLAALLQASVNAPTGYLARLENLDGPMSRGDFAVYLGSLVGQPVSLSGAEPVSLGEVLDALFGLYRLEPGTDPLAEAGRLGLLPEGLVPDRLSRGDIYRILDSAFFNLAMPDGRTLYQARFDDEPPRLTIADFPVVSEALVVTLRGRVAPGTVVLRVGYRDSDLVEPDEEGAWTATVPLEPGMNTITVQAHDAAGNVTTRQLQVLCTAQGS